jgi:competence protein ComEA
MMTHNCHQTNGNKKKENQMQNSKSSLAILVVALSLATTLCANAGEIQTEQGIININTATAAQLSFLPGIGASKADTIMKHREKRPFKKVEDLMRIKGIGRKTLKKLRPYLTITGETTVKKKIQLPPSK